MKALFNWKLLLILIVLLGGFVRFFLLGKIPVGFHIDEAILGYTSYSLIETGKDANNNFLPFYTEVFGDSIPTGYHFLTIIPVKIFGLTVFATRSTGALLGTFIILASFLLAYAIVGNKKISLMTSLFVAISPWQIVLSRGSSEAIAALFFITSGFAFVLWSFYTKRKLHLVIGTILLCLSYFFYHTPRVFVPTMYLAIVIVLYSLWKKHNEIFKRVLLASFLLTSFFAILLVFVLPGGKSRFNQISIFSFPETKLVMEEQIREDGYAHAPLIATRIFHNKVVSYSWTFLNNYLEYFNPQFLFMTGGLPPVFIVPQMGLVYIFELPFLIVGMIQLVVQKKAIYKIPLIWILLAPLTASLTVDDIPNIRRAVVMVPMIELVAAYGVCYVFFALSKKMKFIGGLFFSLVVVFGFTYFLQQYFVNATVHKTWYRNNGFSELMEIVKKSYNQYDKIIMTKATGGVYPLILFHMKFDPKEYQSSGSTKDKEYTGFGKFFFVPEACPAPGLNERYPIVKNAIYVGAGDCPERNYDIYKEDGTKAYRLLFVKTP